MDRLAVVSALSLPTLTTYEQLFVLSLLRDPETGGMRDLDPATLMLAVRSRPLNTRRGRSGHLDRYLLDCEERNVDGLPTASETFANYLVRRHVDDDVGAPSLWGIFYAVRDAHDFIDCRPNPIDDPLIAATIKGIAAADDRQVQPQLAFDQADLRAMLTAARLLDDVALAKRDSCIIAAMNETAARCGEFANADFADLDLARIDVTKLRLRKTKNGKSRGVFLTAYDDELVSAQTALYRWLGVRGTTPGPLFCPLIAGFPQMTRLSPRSIYNVVVDYAALVGLETARRGPHGLRSGHATTQLRGGDRNVEMTRDVMGHADTSTTNRYNQPDIKDRFDYTRRMADANRPRRVRPAAGHG